MATTINIPVQKAPNLQLLTQQLQAIWPDCAIGFLGNDMQVVVQFAADAVPDADIAQTTAICAAHDPTQQSQAQIAAAQQQQAQITLAGELVAIESRLTAFSASAALTDIPSMSAALTSLVGDLATLVHAVGTFFQ